MTSTDIENKGQRPPKRNKTKNEAEYVRELQRIFEANKIPTKAEVWDDTYTSRVDLLVYYFDEVWGIEAKHLNTLGQGGVIAEAYLQIQRYSDLSFKGIPVNRWIIALKYSTHPEIDDLTSRIFLQGFLNKLGIGFLHLQKICGVWVIQIDRGTATAQKFGCQVSKKINLSEFD